MIKEKAQDLYKSRLRLKDIETATQKLIRPMEVASNSEPHTATLDSNLNKKETLVQIRALYHSKIELKHYQRTGSFEP